MPDAPATAARTRPADTAGQRPPRQRADYWKERGAAEALIRLYGSRRLRPTVSLAEAAKIARVSESTIRDTITRARAQQRPPTARRRNPPHPAPPGTKWCGYSQHFPARGEFAPNRAATTGLQSWCRACMVLARREQRRRQAERQAKSRGAA